MHEIPPRSPRLNALFTLVPPAAFGVIVIEASFFVQLRSRQIDNTSLNAAGAIWLLISFLPALALLKLLQITFQGRRILLATSSCLVLLLHTLLLFWHLLARGALDFALLRENAGELVHRDALALVFGGKHRPITIGVLLAVLAAIALELTVRIFSRWGAPPHKRIWLIVSMAVVLAAGALPPHSHDELVNLFGSARAYYFPPPDTLDIPTLRAGGIDPNAPYPYLRHDSTSVISTPQLTNSAPHYPSVFVIAIESFNGRFLGAHTDDGRAITPVLDDAKTKGLLVSRFYASSVQTARGHLALLCGIPPSWRLKEFTAYSKLRLHCLPEELRERGFRTRLFTGQGDLEFDNTDRAMERLGFEERVAMAGKIVADVPPSERWGWGYEDDVLYRKALGRLDEEEHASPGGAYFVLLATISSHSFFDQIPLAKRILYAHPATIEEGYRNALALADHSLQTLFSEIAARPYLRDSIIVITGDHGYPMGAHGSFHNEVGASEDNFRTPLLVIAPGRLAPRIESAPASQIDVAPTLLDLLAIHPATHHFIGRSLVKATIEPQLPVLLSQPYDGRSLVVIEGDLKYARNLFTGDEQLYDIMQDPNEQHDLRLDPLHSAALATLRKGLSFLYLNQRLLDANRIWPPVEMAALKSGQR